MKNFLLSLFFVLLGSYVYPNNNIVFAKKTEVDKELVKTVVCEVKEKYLEGLVNHFLSDVHLLINQLTLFSRNIQFDHLNELSKEELISHYKRALVYAHYLRGLNLLSEGTKEFLIFTILTSFESAFSSPTQLNKFLNNKDLATALFFASAFGLEFEYCNDLKNIINYIKERCAFLENEDLEDVRYESTISEILNELSKEINQYGIFSKITEKIYQSSILKIKEQIENNKSDAKKIKGKKNKK